MLEKDFLLLNDRQKEVVKEIKQNLFVVAPAGTGKTKVIAMRTAYLMKQGVLPDHILCLTFTNKAAREMQTRIRQYIGVLADKVTILTFHSFCYSLIQKEKYSAHVSFPCTIMDEVDSTQFIQSLIASYPIDPETIYYPQILHFIESVKAFSLSLPQQVRYQEEDLFLAYWKEEESKKYQRDRFLTKYGKELYKQYQKVLLENNALDFMELVREAHYLLEQPIIKEKWNKYYHYIHIDEMQDTSIREYRLIQKIAQGNYLALFGDFNQTIYEWRGSNPLSMSDIFKEQFQPKCITLTMNYRSTQLLLDAANDYIASSRLYPVQCKSYAKEKGEKIKLLIGNTKTDELKEIAKNLQQQLSENPSIAVLTRTNAYAKKIYQLFLHYHIPCTVIEDIKLFRRKEVKDILAFFEYGINPRANHAIEKLCKHPYIAMPTWLIKVIKGTNRSYLSLHDWVDGNGHDPYQALAEAFFHNKVVVVDVESTGLCTSKEDIIQIAAIQYGKDGVIDTLDILLKPTKSVGDSYFVHGFSDEQLAKEGINPVIALKRYCIFVEGKVVVGHNILYDLNILSSMLCRYKIPIPSIKKVYDTLDLSYKVYPDLPDHKLSTLADLVRTNTAPSHNALDDILATAEVLAHLLPIILDKQNERFALIEQYQTYIKPYQKLLSPILFYLTNHTVQETIVYLMNDCNLKQYYNREEMHSLRMMYKIADALHNTQLSYLDNIVDFLSFSALHYSEIEQSDLFKKQIPILTIHQAKGLEFETVYLAGCNDKHFPSARSVKENYIEEEHRLFYVGMTRAKKKLYISYHLQQPRSIFLDEINEQYMEKV